MQALTLLQKFFSVDMVIYAAIVLVAATALVRCTMPLSRVAARLRRAARTIVTESKQNKEKKSWNDMHFLGDSLSATWADFLQNAEMRDAHGETCDVTQYINEDTVIYALGRTGFAGLAPGVMTSLGILGTFLGLVMGLSGLSLTGGGYRGRADGDGSVDSRHEHGVPDLDCRRVRLAAVQPAQQPRDG